MIIRREHPADHEAVRTIHVEAFRRDDTEPMEARLLDALRRCDAWIDRLSLVAELDGEIVGHDVCTRGFIDGRPALGLGPIAVSKSRQRDGVGSALMHAMIGAADATDEPLIALLGSPDYYGRFGFVASTKVGIHAPDPTWGPYFQVRTLAAHRPNITGTFHYAEPFDTVT
jgi:putative acetyltransferase